MLVVDLLILVTMWVIMALSWITAGVSIFLIIILLTDKYALGVGEESAKLVSKLLTILVVTSAIALTMPGMNFFKKSVSGIESKILKEYNITKAK